MIKRNLILSPAGAPQHARCAMRLDRALTPVMDEHDWEGWISDVDLDTSIFKG